MAHTLSRFVSTAPLPDSPAASPPVHPKKHATSRAQVIVVLLSLIALGFWCVWWSRSYDQNRLGDSPHVWFDRYGYLGVDFIHNYHAARHWLAGGDPFRQPFGDPLDRKLCYPPTVLNFFVWCALVGPRTAVGIWLVTLALLAAGGAFAAWRSRRSLGLAEVPLPFALLAILGSSPVIFAMERGNYDLILVPSLVAAAWALRERTWRRDLTAGAALALAVSLKIYPALLLASLVPMRRLRAGVIAGVLLVIVSGFQARDLQMMAANLKEMVRINQPAVLHHIPSSTHTLSGSWAMLWEGTHLESLSRIPGPLASAVLLGSLLVWVGLHLYRCPDPRRVILPVFFWIAALATFVPKVANDYSLVFLPMAALAVWDRRDSVTVHLLLGSMLIWAQPVSFFLAPEVLFLTKMLTLLGTAVALVQRIREQTPRECPTVAARSATPAHVQQGRLCLG